MRRIPDYPFPEHDTMDTPKPGSLLRVIVATIVLVAVYVVGTWNMLAPAADRSRTAVLANQETDLGSSYRNANGGQP